MSRNIVDMLNKRETTCLRNRQSIVDSLEDSFWARKDWTPTDYPIRIESVLSTIAIAISPDGRTFATTHGDHTVKVFKYFSNKQYRVFRGHPRTPWTVKYHPTDSNIIASGCLGFEVRVWDIERNTCATHVVLENSIISLAFHPRGDFIGISSGSQLHVWEWRKKLQPEHGGYPPGTPVYPPSRLVIHPRNIRAVAFHPNGEYVFSAAPDPPRLPQSNFTPCRLYAFRFCDIFDPGNNQQPLDLWTLPSLIPEIHLYSDGGMDISADGRYLLTCAVMYSPPAVAAETQSVVDGPSSPMSHRERTAEDESHHDAKRSGQTSRGHGMRVDDYQNTSTHMRVSDSKDSMSDSSEELPAVRTFEVAFSGHPENERGLLRQRHGQGGSDVSDSIPAESSSGMVASADRQARSCIEMQHQAAQPLPQPPSSSIHYEPLPPSRLGGIFIPQHGALKGSHQSHHQMSGQSRGFANTAGAGVHPAWVPVSAASMSAAAMAAGSLRRRDNFVFSTHQLQQDHRLPASMSRDIGNMSMSEQLQSSQDSEGDSSRAQTMQAMSTDRGSESWDQDYSSSFMPPPGGPGGPGGPGSQQAFAEEQVPGIPIPFPSWEHGGLNGGLNRGVRASSSSSSSSGGWISAPQVVAAASGRRHASSHASSDQQTMQPAPSVHTMLRRSPMRIMSSIETFQMNQQERERDGFMGSSSGFQSPYAGRKSNRIEGWPVCIDHKRGEIIPAGWNPVESLCLFELKFYNDMPMTPRLIRHRTLSGALIKAVTSTKVSPTGRYALVGYGVRRAGVVENHPHPEVTCEVLRLFDDDSMENPDKSSKVEAMSSSPKDVRSMPLSSAGNAAAGLLGKEYESKGAIRWTGVFPSNNASTNGPHSAHGGDMAATMSSNMVADLPPGHPGHVSSSQGAMRYRAHSPDSVQTHAGVVAPRETQQDRETMMHTAAVITDEADEVNIAQFHTIAGCGLVYGTKSGKVRVFER